MLRSAGPDVRATSAVRTISARVGSGLPSLSVASPVGYSTAKSCQSRRVGPACLGRPDSIREGASILKDRWSRLALRFVLLDVYYRTKRSLGAFGLDRLLTLLPLRLGQRLLERRGDGVLLLLFLPRVRSSQTGRQRARGMLLVRSA
jgi:hypothetical protein